MAKKSINRKAIQQSIHEGRALGKSDQELYEALTQTYFDKKAVALFITGTVTAELKDKYKLYNNILIGLLGLSVLFKFYVILSIGIQHGKSAALFLLLLFPLLSIYFMYELARYNASMYRVCGILALFGLNRIIKHLDNPTDIAINLVFTIAVVGLAFYLDHKMFPKYRPMSLKKNEQGEYELGG